MRCRRLSACVRAGDLELCVQAIPEGGKANAASRELLAERVLMHGGQNPARALNHAQDWEANRRAQEDFRR